MVLCNDYEPAKAARLARAYDLVGVELRGIQHCRIFVAIAPFTVGVCVKAPVDNAVDFAVACGDARGKRRARLRN